jgi:hypothetical protein
MNPTEISSSPLRASLFTKEDCLPCAQTKQFIYDTFYQDELDWPLLDALTILEKEQHPALVAAFELSMFPTLIIHQDGLEVERIVGGKSIRGNLRYYLDFIANRNYNNQ